MKRKLFITLLLIERNVVELSKKAAPKKGVTQQKKKEFDAYKITIEMSKYLSDLSSQTCYHQAHINEFNSNTLLIKKAVKNENRTMKEKRNKKKKRLKHRRNE